MDTFTNHARTNTIRIRADGELSVCHRFPLK